MQLELLRSKQPDSRTFTLNVLIIARPRTRQRAKIGQQDKRPHQFPDTSNCHLIDLIQVKGQRRASETNLNIRARQLLLLTTPERTKSKSSAVLIV